MKFVVDFKNKDNLKIQEELHRESQFGEFEHYATTSPSFGEDGRS